MARLARRPGEAGQAGPARARSRGCCRPRRRPRCARAQRAAGASTGPSPRPRSSCSASTSSIAPTWTRRSRSARELAAANPGGGLRDPPGRAVFRPGQPTRRHDRPRLDRRGADLRPAPGGRGAAALFPRSRHRRGGLPGRLPARAEELAAERPAARSGRLADPGRPQRRHRRRAPPRRAGSRCPTRSSSPTSTMSRRRWPSGSTAPTIATTCCGCCSSAAIPTCRRPSRSRWRCASSRA